MLGSRLTTSGNTADVGSISISPPTACGEASRRSIPSARTSRCRLRLDRAATTAIAADSKIGTVKATATIDQSEATLTGDVYIVESTTLSIAAFLGIKVHAKVGGVDMGFVRVRGSAAIRGNAVGMDTLFENLPNSITQTSGPNTRTVDFHLEKMTVDLKSDLDGPNEPLLTNPSKCGTPSDFAATVGSGSSLGGIDDVYYTQPYQVDQCDTVKFAASEFAFTATDPVAAENTGFTTQIDIEEGSASMSTLSVKLPASLGCTTPASECRPTDVGCCRRQTRRCSIRRFARWEGSRKSVRSRSPRRYFSQPVTGYVHLVDKTPNPWLGIDVNPDIAGNPPGVTLRLMGTTDVPQRETSCTIGNNNANNCQSNVRVTFGGLPDAPVTSVSMVANGPSRTGDEATLSGETLTISNGTSCQPFDEVFADFTSNAPVDDVQTSTFRTSAQASTVGLTGCTADPIGISGSVVGTETTDTTPTFDIAPGTSPGPNFFSRH